MDEPATSSVREEAELEEELFECARAGSLTRMRELVEIEHVSVNCKNSMGWEPLILAAIWGHAQVARFLLDNGADVDADNALAYLGENHVAVAELLLEYGANVEARALVGNSSRSLLAQAIFYNEVAIVRLFLRYGANTQETLCYGRMYTALYLACRFVRRGHEIVQLLLDHDDGVDVNDFSPSNGDLPAMSPLCAACRNNRLDLVQLLVQNGARVVYDGVYPDVPCPLKHAVEHGSLQLVQLLLDNRPMARERVTHPLSLPLETALHHNKLEAAQLLVDHGANVNDRPFLCMCSRVGGNEGAKLLLQAGADVNQVDNGTGETPLWAAAKSGHVDVVKELLKAGADASICNNAGEKPLEVAHRKGHKGIVYLLLRTSPPVWSRLRAAW